MCPADRHEGEPATGSRDFYDTSTERGLRKRLNWPVIWATVIAILVVVVLFLIS